MHEHGAMDPEEYAKAEGLEIDPELLDKMQANLNEQYETREPSQLAKIIAHTAKATRAYYEGLLQQGLDEQTAIELTKAHSMDLKTALSIGLEDDNDEQ